MKKIYSILKGIITIFLFMVLVIVILQRASGNKISFIGYQMYSIVSESMAPKYLIGDVIIDKELKPNEYNVGDDITYYGTKGDMKGLVVTHRIIEKEQKDGKYYFITKGIANDYEDPEINEDNILGKVIYHTTLLSFVGKLMTNIYIYYFLFVTAGVCFFYSIIRSFILVKKDDESIDE